VSQDKTAAAAGGRGDDTVDVIVVGAGQAGLAIGHFLAAPQAAGVAEGV